MARPEMYNWEAIEEAYTGGFDRDEICKKYRITPKILSNRINKYKWEVKGTITSDISELNEHVHLTAQNLASLHPANQEMAIERTNTQQVDNELMQGNRKIAKLLLSIIAQKRDDITLKNIRNVSGTLRDIEAIANPQASRVEVNNTNAVQTNNNLEIEFK